MKNIYSLFTGMAIFFLATPIFVFSQISVPSNFQVEEFASVDNPIGIKIDQNGDILFVEFTSTSFGNLKKITIEDGQNAGISTLASSVPGIQYIAIDKAGNILTASSGRQNGDVIKISPDDGSFSTFIPGSGGILKDGRGIEPLSNGNILVANNILSFEDAYINGFVTQFLIDENGDYLDRIDAYIDGFPQGKKPLDLESVAAIYNGMPVTKVYIASDNTVSEAIINESGTVISFNSDFSVLPGPESAFAAGIAITPCGEVFVSQVTPGAVTGGKIYKLDEEGTATEFASGFNQPRDQEIDQNGDHWVTDFGNNKIYKISSAVCDTYICGGFENERTEREYTCMQEAINDAESGDNIIVRAVPPAKIRGRIPRGKTIIISSPDGESREIDELIVSGNASIKGEMTIGKTILEGGEIKLDAIVNIGLLEGSGNVQSRTGTVNIDNTCMVFGNIDLGSAGVSTFNVVWVKGESITRIIGTATARKVKLVGENAYLYVGGGEFEVTDGIEGGSPNNFIIPLDLPGTVFKDADIERMNADRILPVGKDNTEEGYSPIAIKIGELAIGDQIVGVIMNHVRPNPGGGGSFPDYVFPQSIVDTEWKWGVELEPGTTLEEAIPVDFYFHDDAILGSAVRENPVIVHNRGGEFRHYPGTFEENLTVIQAVEVPNDYYNIVRAEVEVVDPSSFAIIGCASCTTSQGNGQGPSRRASDVEKVEVCMVSRSPVSRDQTMCIPKSWLQRFLDLGNYCGPCQETTTASIYGGGQGLDAVQNSNQEFGVYPNPANRQFTITFEQETVNPQLIRLVDMSGRTVRQLTTDAGAFSAVMNLQGLAKGVYVLHVQDGVMSRQVKIVVE